jgi:hypothetical protein
VSGAPRNTLARIRRLTPGDLALLLRALWALGVVKVGLRVAPFERVRRYAEGRRRAPADRPGAPTRERIAWAVTALSRRLPGETTCLPQALAALALLGRYGYDAELRVGVAKSDDGEFLAHAWVESGGRVIIGGHERQFAPLTLPDGSPL